MSHAINWFEIPTLDLNRAVAFYEQVLALKLHRDNVGGFDLAIFPSEGANSVHGALIRDPQREPSPQGSLLYLNTADLDGALSRIPAAGGAITQPKLSIGEHGFIALLRDSEGNVVGLHSHK